jgi:hypothetical protein
MREHEQVVIISLTWGPKTQENVNAPQQHKNMGTFHGSISLNSCHFIEDDGILFHMTNYYIVIMSWVTTSVLLGSRFEHVH